MKLKILFFTSAVFVLSCNLLPEPVELNPCPKVPENLPTLTTSGLNKLGCKVDGNNWVNMGNPFDELFAHTASILGTYNNQTNYFSMYATLRIHSECDSISEKIRLSALLPAGVTINKKLPIIRQGSEVYKDWYAGTGCSKYYLDTIKTNFIEFVKFDVENFIASGRFEFTAQNECGDEKKFTDGRFDVNFHP